MRPGTSFEAYRRRIDGKTRDAEAFVALGATDDARRVRTEIVTLVFGGVTTREMLALIQHSRAALRVVDRLIANAEVAR